MNHDRMLQKLKKDRDDIDALAGKIRSRMLLYSNEIIAEAPDSFDSSHNVKLRTVRERLANILVDVFGEDRHNLEGFLEGSRSIDT